MSAVNCCIILTASCIVGQEQYKGNAFLCLHVKDCWQKSWTMFALCVHRLSCIIAVSGGTAQFVDISFSLNGYDIYGNHSNGARFQSPSRYPKSSHDCNIVPSTKKLWPSFLSNVTLLLTQGVTCKRHTCPFSCENSADLSIGCTCKVGVKATRD